MMTSMPPGGGDDRFITLYTHNGIPVLYPRPKGKPTFNLSRGDGVSWAKWTWNWITGCLHGCDYCLPPGTPVLMADMTWRAIGDIRPGDQVIAFDEESPQYTERRWRAAEVTHAWRTVQTAYKITLSDGREVTASGEHRWLCARNKWVATKDLRAGSQIRSLFPRDAVPQDEDDEAGYLAGAAPTARQTGDSAEKARFLAAVQPALVRKDPGILGRKVRTSTVTVTSVASFLAIEMVDITTSTGTFIADGLLTHNCYAREIALSSRSAKYYPAGFTPVFHPGRLTAPLYTSVPAAHRDDPAWHRVFSGSQADNYGRWVPDEWIAQGHAAMRAGPRHWQYILLTKFPARYVGLDMPAGAWIGTSVDERKRVRIAEDAFRQLPVEGTVRWLSLEPLLEPLEFTDLSMFDWVVIGAQTATRQPGATVPAFAPPFEWVARIVAQAREAGCKVHLKPNLLGRVSSQLPGMQLPDEYPGNSQPVQAETGGPGKTSDVNRAR
jgi:protein gp37